MRNAVLLIASLIILIPLGSCKADGQASAAMRTWDNILSEDYFKEIANFERAIQQEDNERVYIYSAFAGEVDDAKLLMSIVIAVGPAGKRLDPATWESAVSAVSDLEKARDFPEIGIRAQVQAPTFSPQGAMSKILFTTSDELFDVLVSLYEASSDSPRGSVTVDDMAKRIDRAYLGTFQ